MKFFRTITNSLVSKDFYEGLLNNPQPKPVKKGLWYLFRVYIIVALFLTILISINISAVLPKLDAIAREVLPPGAEIIIRDGVLTTNTNPIVIPMPTGAVKIPNPPATDSTTPDLNNLVVLDITASTTIEALEERNTIGLITSDGFIFQGDGGRYTVGKFANVKDLDVTIDEEWIVGKIGWVKTFAKFVPFITFSALLIGLYIWSLLASLIYALIILLIMRIQKKDHAFSIAYVVALYSRTVGLAIGLLAFLIPFLGIGPVSIALQLIFITFMIRTKKAIISTEDDTHEIQK